MSRRERQREGRRRLISIKELLTGLETQEGTTQTGWAEYVGQSWP